MGGHMGRRRRPASSGGRDTRSDRSRLRIPLAVVGAVALFAVVALASALLLRPLVQPAAGDTAAQRADLARRTAELAVQRIGDDVARLRAARPTPNAKDLTSVADLLAEQERMLAGPGGASPGATGSGAASSSTAPSLTSVARALHDAGLRSLRDATTIGGPAGDGSTSPGGTATPAIENPAPEGGMARLLAATGTAQIQWSERLARAAGVTLPDVGAAAITATAPGTATTAPTPTPSTAPTSATGAGSASGSPTGSATGSVTGLSPSALAAPSMSCPPAAASGSGAAEPTGEADASSPTASAGTSSSAPGPAAAFSRVQVAEQQAVYVYEVLRARAPREDADGNHAAVLAFKPSAAAAARQAHEQRLSQLVAIARSQCRAMEPRRAGFPLDRAVLDGFTAGDAAVVGRTVASVEAATTLAWGDAVAFGDPSLRTVAVATLLDAARTRTTVTGTIDPVPGLSEDLRTTTAAADSSAPAASTGPADNG